MIAESKAEDPGPLDDVVVVEPMQTRPRTLAGTPGRLVANGRRDKQGNLVSSACTMVKMSPMAITFSASVNVSVGDWVVVQFEQLGKFEGPILQVTKRTLAMRIVATQQERDNVAARLAWFEDSTRAERRRFERFVPIEPKSSLSLSSGETLPCMVMDYSAGGAAVLADVAPAKGTALRIAKVVAEVVRHFNGGFAVNFPTVQDPKAVASLLLEAA